MSSMIDPILQHNIDRSGLWTGDFKIPWDEPAFSARMLRQHLTSDHHLASRAQAVIDQQVEWLHTRLCDSRPADILDLGCGPGLYAPGLLTHGHTYEGIDISPASIEHARQHVAGACTFRQGDMLSEELGDGRDAVMFIYGEFNVFAAEDQRRLLGRIHRSLHPGGRVVLEPQRYDAVKAGGQAPPTWYRSGEGLASLFGDTPHLVLQESHWLPDEEVAVQVFFVLDSVTKEVRVYRNTTRAIREEDVAAMLGDAGFAEVQVRNDWPAPQDSLYLISARKPG